MVILIGLVFLLINIGSTGIHQDVECPRKQFEQMEEMFISQEKDFNYLTKNSQPFENEYFLSETWEIEVPFYSQNDERWKGMEYGKGTLGGSGCIPTSVAMVLSFAGHEMNPAEVAKFAIKNDHVVCPPEYGTKFSLFSHIAKSKGLKYEEIKNIGDIFEHLRENRLVIMVGRGAPYNSGEIPYGHALVVRGFQEEISLYIHDPNDFSKERIFIHQIKENPPSLVVVIY